MLIWSMIGKLVPMFLNEYIFHWFCINMFHILLLHFCSWNSYILIYLKPVVAWRLVQCTNVWMRNRASLSYNNSWLSWNTCLIIECHDSSVLVLIFWVWFYWISHLKEGKIIGSSYPGRTELKMILTHWGHDKIAVILQTEFPIKCIVWTLFYFCSNLMIWICSPLSN